MTVAATTLARIVGAPGLSRNVRFSSFMVLMKLPEMRQSWFIGSALAKLVLLQATDLAVAAKDIDLSHRSGAFSSDNPEFLLRGVL